MLLLIRSRLRLQRTTNVWWTLGLAVLIAATVGGYVGAYPDAASRASVNAQFGQNVAFSAFYGPAVDLSTPGGFLAWRLGNMLVVAVGIWTGLAVARLTRGEEDDGRGELLLASPVTPTRVLVADLAATGAALAAFGVVAFLTQLAVGLGAAGSAVFAATAALGGAVFGGVAAVTAQLLPTRRGAVGWTLGVLAGLFFVRVASDLTPGLDWLAWLSPFGWANKAHAHTDDRLGPVLLLLATALVLAGAAVLLRRRRDVGASVLDLRDRGRRGRPMGSALALSFRLERASVVAWVAIGGSFFVLLGLLARDVADAIGTDPNLQETIRRFGMGAMDTAVSYLAASLSFLGILAAFFAVTQLVAVREEETAGRLDTLLALPVARVRWLAGRLVVLAGGLVVLCVVAVGGAWLGAMARGVGPGWADVPAAALNAAWPAVPFVGLVLLTLGLAPRAVPGVAYGSVAAASFLDLVGAAVSAPAWVLDVSPFHHVSRVPTQPFAVLPAAVAVAVGVVAGAVGVVAFARRDLQGP